MLRCLAMIGTGQPGRYIWSGSVGLMLTIIFAMSASIPIAGMSGAHVSDDGAPSQCGNQRQPCRCNGCCDQRVWNLRQCVLHHPAAAALR